MPKSFYTSAIFFTGVYFLVNCILFIIFTFRLGDRVLFLQHLPSLHVLQFLISLGWSMIMLKYYRNKRFLFPFWVVIVSIPVYIIESILIRYFLITLDFPVNQYHLTCLALGLGVVYGLSLVFSSAGRRSWLRLAGIILMFSGLALVSTLVWRMSSMDSRMNGTIAEFDLWLFLINNFSLIFFILNFLKEKDKLKSEEEIASPQPILVGAMNVAGVIALLCTFYIGIMSIQESKWVSEHPNHVPEQIEKLAEPFEARIYVGSQGDTLRYRLMKPLEYDSAKLYPLTISLHGSGAVGTDNAKQLTGTIFPHLLSAEENRRKYPSFLFVPQCPFNTWWGDSSGDLKMDALIIECILDLERGFSIDAGRRYLTGVSLGGYGTWHLISTQSELFAAAIPISGAGSPAGITDKITLPIWAFHGAKDGLVPVSGSREMIDALQKAGGNPKYTEYPDLGHNLFAHIKDSPEILDWLFSQKQNSSAQ